MAFLYSVDGGEVVRYNQDASKELARLIDTYSFDKIKIQCEWERDDFSKYHLPPPPPEHEFDTSESCSMLVILNNKSRFSKQTFQRLPEMFLKLLPGEVLKHLLATDRQREFITELSLITHLVPQPHKAIFDEASRMVKYKYLTKKEASWYIERMLHVVNEWEKIYIKESVSP
jgi:hypothetical protein